ncbi:MAG: aminoglycoside phosphotransferase family protein [Proteobacteria bacterium]|nr:aminoglycoside phosphotransferase family protein [Pseudomonadota bacterium]
MSKSDIEEFSEIARALGDMRLLAAGEQFAISRLSGGVSCDVYRVQLDRGPVCVKRALPKLRVEADWRAPPERAATEVAWIRLVAGINPDWVPKILGEDRARHLFVMEFLTPETFPVWKGELAAGWVDVGFAAKVGAALACVHASTAGRQDLARAFDNGAQFHALRLEPYLYFTADRHSDVAPRIREIADGVAKARIALMQGDVSPKNILCGPRGPVFLDAETACYGDPAFDLAFCLNHLLLKCVWHPENTQLYMQSFDALRHAYFAGATWEEPRALDIRVAALLSAFLLARIEGKSPVEYLTAESHKDFVRQTAKELLRLKDLMLANVEARWSADRPSFVPR